MPVVLASDRLSSSIAALKLEMLAVETGHPVRKTSATQIRVRLPCWSDESTRVFPFP